MASQIIIEQEINGDGFLQVNLPLGKSEAGKHARITVDLMEPSKQLSQVEWRAGILATAGGWQGEFERPPQGELEVRMPLS